MLLGVQRVSLQPHGPSSVLLHCGALRRRKAIVPFVSIGPCPVECCQHGQDGWVGSIPADGKRR